MEKNEMKENKENVVIDDFDFSLIADFFKRVDRQGPGGEWETRLATSLIPDFKRKIRIATWDAEREARPSCLPMNMMQRLMPLICCPK